MSIHHAPAARPAAHAQVSVRDHREARPPAVVRGERREVRPVVRIDRGRDRDHDRARPIIERNTYVAPRRVYIAPTPVYVQPSYASWTASPSYTYAPQPIDLMAPTSLASDQLSVDVNLGGATSLELDAAGGSTFVSQVVLVDAYGSSQAIPVNQMLSAQNPTIQLPLAAGSSTVRVIIDGHSDWGGQLSMRAL
jgi:hypothetical protein